MNIAFLDFTPFELTVLGALVVVLGLLVLFALGVFLGYVVRWWRGAESDLPNHMRRQAPVYYRKEWDEERNCWRAIPVFRPPPLIVDDSAAVWSERRIGGAGRLSPCRGEPAAPSAGDLSRDNPAAKTNATGAAFNG